MAWITLKSDAPRFRLLYNDRAISYRVHKGFEHDIVALSASAFNAWCVPTAAHQV